MLQRGEDHDALGFGQRDAHRDIEHAFLHRRARRAAQRDQRHGELHRLFAQDVAALHGVAQLAHVARPRVLAQRRQGGAREGLVGLVRGVELRQEMVGQRFDVFVAVAQRRHVQRHHRQPIHQVFAEGAVGHGLRQIAVGRGDDARAGLDRLRAAHAHERAGLQHAQQLDLHLHRHLGDLVEEDRAVAGLLEIAGVALERAGEAALLVAEQLRFDQVGRDRAAVDGDEGLVSTRAHVVHGARDQFLAGARFSDDQHGCQRAGHLADLAIQRAHDG